MVCMCQVVEAAERVGATIEYASSYALHRSLQRLYQDQHPKVRLTFVCVAVCGVVAM